MTLVAIILWLKLHKPIVIVLGDDPFEHLLYTLEVENC
jgi:hypothetical protein